MTYDFYALITPDKLDAMRPVVREEMLGEVRNIVRKVVEHKSLGFVSAKKVLLKAGGGARNVPDIKPELYDKVFKACQALLKDGT
jgi:hypothetical protein